MVTTTATPSHIHNPAPPTHTCSPMRVVRLGATLCILVARYSLSCFRYSASSITRVAKRSMLIRSRGEMSMPEWVGRRKQRFKLYEMPDSPSHSLIPRPSGGKKRVAWYPLFAHVRSFPEKPGNPHMFGNHSYNRYVYVRFISASSMMAVSLLILPACSMVLRHVFA